MSSAATVTIGFFLTDQSDNILTDSRGAPLLSVPLPGLPQPYGFSNGATWTELFTNGTTIRFAAYDPICQILQVVYISGEIIYLLGIPPDIRTAFFLARNAEKYLLQLISTLTP